MTTRFLALALALCLAFTAVVPAAPALAMSDEELQKVYEQMQGGEIPDSVKQLIDDISASTGVDLSDPKQSDEYIQAITDYFLGNSAGAPASAPTNNNEYTYEVEPGKTLQFGKRDPNAMRGITDMSWKNRDGVRYVYDEQPKSDNPAVATAKMEIKTEGYADSLSLTVYTHAPGEATITATAYTEVSPTARWYEGVLLSEAPYEISDIDNWTIHVTVKDVLQPPKVELRIMPETQTKLVTGAYRITDYLDITGEVVDAVFEKAPELIRRFGLTPAEYRAVKGTNKSWQFNRRMRVYLERDIVKIPNSIRSRFPKLKLPASIKLPASSVKNFVINNPKWVSASAAAGKLTAQTLYKITPFGIAQWIVQKALEQVKSPRVDPEVTLEVTITNPNSVPIYLDLWLSTPRVTHEGEKPLSSMNFTDAVENVLEHLGSELPDGVLSPPTETPVKARDLFVLYPEGDPSGDSSQTFKFKLDPEIVYNETIVNEMMSTHKRYVSDITVSGTWWENAYCEDPAKEYEESIQLEVESFLLPKSEYQQLDHLFSDLTTAVMEVFQSLTAQPGMSDSAFVELLDSLPEGAPLMSPIGPPAPADAVRTESGGMN